MKDHRTEERDSEQAAASASTSRQELRGYEQLKFNLAALLREIMAFARERRDQSLERQARELQVRLAADRFNLAVIGQFSRGKSTLMNALLGLNRLPTGVVPVTSVITSVSYGTHERVLLHFQNSNLSSEVPLEELAHYVTEQGNPGNKKKIQVAEVQLPAELLQRGFYFVDTPGLGSAILANTETTRGFFPQCDAVIFVTTVESPLTAEELASFEEVARYVRQIFLTINKMDLVSVDQRDEVIKFVHRQVARTHVGSDVEIFPVSAQEGLQSKLAKDERRLSQTGLPELERALMEFLTARKAEDFLLLMCNRTGALLSAMPGDLRANLATRLNQTRLQISQGRSKIANGEPDELSKFSPFEALRPCPICERVLNVSFDFLSQYQYDRCTKADVQTAHAGANGFCAWHTWQYERIASPQGICSAYPKIIEKFAERCRDLARKETKSRDTGYSLSDGLFGRVYCPVCNVASEAENEALQLVLLEVEDQSSGEAPLPNLCVPHLQALGSRLQDEATYRELFSHEAGVLDQLAESMQRFALKHEGLSMHLAKDEERKAPKQALTLLVGHPNSRTEATK